MYGVETFIVACGEVLVSVFDLLVCDVLVVDHVSPGHNLGIVQGNCSNLILCSNRHCQQVSV